jgi:hypothetical protein
LVQYILIQIVLLNIGHCFHQSLKRRGAPAASQAWVERKEEGRGRCRAVDNTHPCNEKFFEFSLTGYLSLTRLLIAELVLSTKTHARMLHRQKRQLSDVPSNAAAVRSRSHLSRSCRVIQDRLGLLSPHEDPMCTSDSGLPVFTSLVPLLSVKADTRRDVCVSFSGTKGLCTPFDKHAETFSAPSFPRDTSEGLSVRTPARRSTTFARKARQKGRVDEQRSSRSAT